MPLIYKNRALIVVSIILSGFCPTYAAEDIAFTDPNDAMTMRDAKWDAQALQYRKEDINADLVISLDQQQYPYLKTLIDNFALKHNKVISISDGTCGISAGKLRRKTIDIGGFCCPPSKLDRLPGLKFHTLGIASLALIANQDVPVQAVTIEQAKKIFKGDITQWSEVSLNQSDTTSISPIVRPHCSKRPGHWRLIVPSSKEFAKNRLKVGSIPDMLKRTSKNDGAIGYETLWMINHYKDKEPVKMLAIDGKHAEDLKALAAGLYPFYRTFNLTTWQNGNPLADELVAYLKLQIIQTPRGKHTLVGSDELKKNGWVFKQDELISGPKNGLYGIREG